MAIKNRPTLDLQTLAANLVEEFRSLARRAPGARGSQGEGDSSRKDALAEQLRGVTEELGDEHRKALQRANERYRERTEAMSALLEERRQRLEAYAIRKRQVVPTDPESFVVAGRVTDEATGKGLPHVRVRAADLDRRTDDALGESRTDALGYYRIEYRAEDFDEADGNPETYIEVLDDQGKVLSTSTKSFIQKAGRSAFIPAEVDGTKLPASLRIADKVGRTVTKRRDDLERRRRLIDSMSKARVRPTVGGSGEGTSGKARVGKAGAGTGKAAVDPRKEKTEDAPAEAIKGIGATYAERLEKAGVRQAREVASLAPKELARILEVSEERAGKLLAEARKTGKS